MELELAPFSLQEALERGVVMMRERATRDGITLTLGPASRSSSSPATSAR